LRKIVLGWERARARTGDSRFFAALRMTARKAKAKAKAKANANANAEGRA
jgi:hypothetical protein